MWGVVIIAKSNKNRTVNLYFQLFICNMFLLFVRYLHRCMACFYVVFAKMLLYLHQNPFCIIVFRNFATVNFLYI